MNENWDRQHTGRDFQNHRTHQFCCRLDKRSDAIWNFQIKQLKCANGCWRDRCVWPCLSCRPFGFPSWNFWFIRNKKTRRHFWNTKAIQDPNEKKLLKLTHSQGWRSRANSLGGSCLHQNGPSFWRGRLKACMHIKRQRRRSSSSSSNDPTAHIFYSIHSNVSQRELSIQWQQNIAADDDLSVWCDRRNHW